MKELDIKGIRKKLELNQKDFAEMLGVGERAVQTWESGERNISQSAGLLLGMILKENEQSVVRVKSGKGDNIISLEKGSTEYIMDLSDVSDLDILQYIHKNMDRFRESSLCKKVFQSMFLDDYIEELKIERRKAKEEALRITKDTHLK